MANVMRVEYTRNKAKVYLSDGRQSPKLEIEDVNKWVAENKDKKEDKET